jgi:hypothetical protein
MASSSSQRRRPESEEERILAIFGLPPHGTLPVVNKETLLTYHEYLAGALKFPFQALYAETTPPVRQIVRYVTVVGLSESERRRLYGLFCRVNIDGAIVELPLSDLGIQQDDPNRQLIDDYLYWLWKASE